MIGLCRLQKNCKSTFNVKFHKSDKTNFNFCRFESKDAMLCQIKDLGQWSKSKGNFSQKTEILNNVFMRIFATI